MKVRTKEQRATLLHPVYPEVRATVRRLTSVQQMQQKAALREIQAKTQIIPITDVGGAHIRAEDGTLETREIPPVAELIEHALRQTLVTVEGLESLEDGTPIPFENNFDEVFAYLWSDELAFEEDVDGGKRRTTFAMWIARKAGRKETFDPDPLAPSSPTRPQGS